MNSKRIYLLVLGIFIGSMMFTACKKKGCIDPLATNYNAEADKDDGSCTYPDPEPTPTIPFTAKIDGTEFIEDAINASVSSFSQTLTIEGTKSNGEYVRVKMPASITPGTYSFEDPDLGYQAGYYNDGSSPYGAANGTGTLTISSHNQSSGSISGFFSFTAGPYSFSSGSNSYVVSDGEFVVTY